MKATDFEDRHSILVHQFIVAAAFLTYLVDPDDIVWRFMKGNATHRLLLERSLFAIATLLVGAAAGICTWTGASQPVFVAQGRSDLRFSGSRRRSRYLGELLYAIGLGSLAPLWGFVILVAGEAIRIFRLLHPRHDLSEAALSGRDGLDASDSRWQEGFRGEASKWGMFLAMVVFTITLRDRVVEVLAGVACLIGLLLMLPFFSRPRKNADI